MVASYKCGDSWSLVSIVLQTFDVLNFDHGEFDRVQPLVSANAAIISQWACLQFFLFRCPFTFGEHCWPLTYVLQRNFVKLQYSEFRFEATIRQVFPGRYIQHHILTKQWHCQRVPTAAEKFIGETESVETYSMASTMSKPIRTQF